MKRRLLIFAILLLVGVPTFAQTTVNLTVTDTPDNQLWANGTWTVKLVSAGGSGNLSFNVVSGGGSTAGQTGSLSGTATAAIVLPANANIAPGGSAWQFTVCPQASAGCFQQNVTVSTSSPQTLGITPPSIRVNLTTAVPPVSLYSTGEVTQAVLGSQFFLIGTGQQFCTAVTGTTCNTWGGSGGGIATNGTGGTTNPASPVMATEYLSNFCPVANTGSCIFTPADTQQVNDCGWVAGTPATVTCSTPHFVVGDVGKKAMGAATCANDQVTADYGGALSTTALVTITGFTSSTTITVSSAANTTTISAVFPQGGCFIFGHTDDTGFSTADTALQAAATCPKLELAASNYLIESPHFFTNPNACANIGPGIGGNFGDTILVAGFVVQGRCTGCTALYLAPSFPNGDACNHGGTGSTTGQAHSGGCFAPPMMGAWMDFRIDGGFQVNAPNLASHTLIFNQITLLQNFSCLNYGALQGGSSVGIEMNYQVQLYQVNNAGCGAIAFWQDTGSGQSTGFRVVSESAGFESLRIAGPCGSSFFSDLPCFICYWCQLWLGSNQPFGASANVHNLGGAVRFIGGSLAPDNFIGGQNNGNWDYQCTVAGGVMWADGVSLSAFGGTTNSNGGISHTAACTDYLHEDLIKSQSASFDIQNVAGSKEYFLGGNILTPRVSLAGQVYGENDPASQTIVTAAKTVLSAGWGTTAAVTALSGFNSPIQFTVTNSGTGQGASPTITYTFPTAYIVAPYSCTAVQTGGTNATGTFASSALSATGVTFTFSLTPTAAATEIVQVTCVTP